MINRPVLDLLYPGYRYCVTRQFFGLSRGAVVLSPEGLVAMVWSRSPRLDALGGGRAPGELGTWAWWDEGIGGTNATNSSGSGQTPDDWGAFPHMDLLAWSYFGLLAVADAFVFILIVAALGGFLRVLCDRSPRIARASMGAKPSATRKAAHKRTPSSKRRRPKARRGEVAAAPDVEEGAKLERATLERATLERAPLSLDRGLIPSVPLSLVATSADAGVRVLEDGAARAPPPHTGVSEPVRPARAAWPPSGGGGSGGGSGGGGGGGGGDVPDDSSGDSPPAQPPTPSRTRPRPAHFPMSGAGGRAVPPSQWFAANVESVRPVALPGLPPPIPIGSAQASPTRGENASPSPLSPCRARQLKV